MGFSVVVVLYSYIVQAEPEKFVVAANFAELVSTVALTCLKGEGFDPLGSTNGWGILTV